MRRSVLLNERSEALRHAAPVSLMLGCHGRPGLSHLTLSDRVPTMAKRDEEEAPSLGATVVVSGQLSLASTSCNKLHRRERHFAADLGITHCKSGSGLSGCRTGSGRARICLPRHPRGGVLNGQRGPLASGRALQTTRNPR